MEDLELEIADAKNLNLIYSKNYDEASKTYVETCMRRKELLDKINDKPAMELFTKMERARMAMAGQKEILTQLRSDNIKLLAHIDALNQASHGMSRIIAAVNTNKKIDF